jgi:hypothetical protein
MRRECSAHAILLRNVPRDAAIVSQCVGGDADRVTVTVIETGTEIPSCRQCRVRSSKGCEVKIR